MYKLNEKAASLKPYQPIKGQFTARLDANESFMDLSEEIKEEIAKSIKQIEFNRYPDPAAEKVCGAFADFFGLDKDLITAGNGSDELISVIVNGFFERGDKVVITSPDFSMYGIYCHIAELKAITIQKNCNLELSAEQIIFTAKENNAKGVILSNPCNPTSKAMGNKEILSIITSLPDTLVVIDEAYMDFMGEGIVKQAHKYSNLIVLKTCSKAFGLAAIRLGFAIANKTLTNALRALKSPYNVNSLSSAAGEVVLRHKDFLVSRTKTIIEQKQKLFDMLSAIEGITAYISSSNFVVVRTDKAKQIFEYVINKGIAIRLLGDCLRINAGSDSEQQAFIKAFKEAL